MIESTILWIFAAIFVLNFAYAIIAPLLPLQLLEQGVEPTGMAIIFGIYAVAVVLWSPIVSS